MEHVTKTFGEVVGDWIVANVGWTVIIILFLLSCFFKIAKKEIDPLGWVIGLIGKPLTKAVRDDVANVRKDLGALKEDNKKQFDNIKTDRAKSIKDLKDDYDSKITELREDIDGFEEKTNKSICEIQKGTSTNCKVLKRELDAIKKSNDLQTVRQIRAHVLDFANSCMNHRRHTKQEFDNIIQENEQYESLVKKYKIKNAVYKEDYAFIMSTYHECQSNNSFLKNESEANG